ncbi:MAG: hypothetical protein J7L25_13420 [Deltaproteobacteria bacterium]|nr:hypothetical protein [Candidatus Tharpella aukensis]
MAKIVIACNKLPLAAFIETALNRCLVDCQIAVDAAQLLTLVTELKPDALLFEAEFPTLAESSALLGNLRTESPQIPIVGIFAPFVEIQGDIGPGFSPENVLRLPFGEDELSEKLQQVAGLEMKKRTAPLEKKGEEEMDKPQSNLVETVELVDIVEEGLPLDGLPQFTAGESSEVFQEAGSNPAGVDTLEPAGELAEEFELDDFGDTLDDLESTFAEPAEVASDAVVESDVETEFNKPEPELEVESEVKETLSELIDGDTDALLADDDFAEVKIPESSEAHDPVLAELKSAGLTAEDEIVEASASEIVSPLSPESKEENDFVEEELSDIDDLSGEISIEEDAAAAAAAGSLAEVGAEESEIGGADQDEEVEFSEMVLPEVAVDPEESFLQTPVPKAAEAPEAAAASEEIFTAESPDAEIELPEDYLIDEELSVAGVDTDIGSQPETEPVARAISTPPPLKLKTEEPEVCEQISPDFSRQIESMTQEWSKQLLNTTYASMDKMIKAIGDLAPTIVDQVAREVIPPLAEKVIKAEIARLEEKLEREEEQEDSNS